MHELQAQGINFRTFDGLVNTSALGKFAPVLIGLLSGLAEVETLLIRVRTRESVEYRRATGGNLGARPKTSDKKKKLVLKKKEA